MLRCAWLVCFSPHSLKRKYFAVKLTPVIHFRFSDSQLSFKTFFLLHLLSLIYSDILHTGQHAKEVGQLFLEGLCLLWIISLSTMWCISYACMNGFIKRSFRLGCFQMRQIYNFTKQLLTCIVFSFFFALPRLCFSHTLLVAVITVACLHQRHQMLSFWIP